MAKDRVVEECWQDEMLLGNALVGEGVGGAVTVTVFLQLAAQVLVVPNTPTNKAKRSRAIFAIWPGIALA